MRVAVRSVVITAACALGAAAGAAWGAADPGRPTAPRMEFVPPAAGTYRLERIQPAANAVLLEHDARTKPLSTYTRGKITLLTFFYTYCVDPWGCPFAYWTLSDLRDLVLADPTLARRVRFVSVSFDPTNDTPQALARYGARFIEDDRMEWRFLTARSVPELVPLLDGFGQDASVAYDELGRPTRTINHTLKMFLIDADGIVREIYSLAFLQKEVMLNDLRTLALEERRSTARPAGREVAEVRR